MRALVAAMLNAVAISACAQTPQAIRPDRDFLGHAVGRSDNRSYDAITDDLADARAR
jgi:hypothetical protein